MKNKIGLLSIMVLILLITGCNSKNKKNGVQGTDSVAVTQVESTHEININTVYSAIHWKGFKPGGSHHGTLKLKEGKAYYQGDSLVGGYAVVDMKSLKVEDLEGEDAEKLRGHLLSQDFFDADQYPQARFEITSISRKTADTLDLSGNLTIKDVTKNISFPVGIGDKTIDKNKVFCAFAAPFTINRVDWNVKYGSKNVFKNLGDKFIDDGIEISIDLQSNPVD
ncbi:YceI family protein [Porphyromonas pogonae]|uniref:YceI family protein n=1 Tax=Porphyromonas pogonae TaxID=867595 RepID=UPI002E77DFB0|nr:YceI family protein [Porphyromonas pogonae]